MCHNHPMYLKLIKSSPFECAKLCSRNIQLAKNKAIYYKEESHTIDLPSIQIDKYDMRSIVDNG